MSGFSVSIMNSSLSSVELSYPEHHFSLVWTTSKLVASSLTSLPAPVSLSQLAARPFSVIATIC